MKLYHYSKSIKEIKEKGFISPNSFSKTNTYDVILETCPEIFLDNYNLNILKKSKPKKRKSYESKYSHVKLKFKNKLLNEFFNHNKYVLAFDEILPMGWIKSGMFQLLSKRIGNKYYEFKIDKETAKKSFVLEQRYWSPKWSLKKFKKNSWKKGFEIWNYPEIVKEVFGKYYLSIKRLWDYKKGEFKVPEFWIYGKIARSKCKLGEVDKKLFSKYIKEGGKLRLLK